MKAEKHSRKKGRGRNMTFLVNPKVLNQSGKEQHAFDFGRYYTTFFGEGLKAKGEDKLHQLSGHESEQTPTDSGGQGSLARFCPWDCKEPDMTERLNNSNNIIFIYFYLPFKHCLLTWTSDTPCTYNSFVCVQSLPTLCGPMDCSVPGSSVHGISRQEYWSWLPLLLQGILPT